MNDVRLEDANHKLADIETEDDVQEMKEANTMQDDEIKEETIESIPHSDDKGMEQTLSTELIIRYGHHSEQGMRRSMEVFPPSLHSMPLILFLFNLFMIVI